DGPPSPGSDQIHHLSHLRGDGCGIRIGVSRLSCQDGSLAESWVLTLVAFAAHRPEGSDDASHVRSKLGFDRLLDGEVAAAAGGSESLLGQYGRHRLTGCVVGEGESRGWVLVDQKLRRRQMARRLVQQQRRMLGGGVYTFQLVTVEHPLDLHLTLWPVTRGRVLSHHRPLSGRRRGGSTSWS